MFRSATIKMTLLYAAIVMVISLFFSVSLYRISIQEIEYNLTKQQNNFQTGGRLRQFDFLEDAAILETERELQLEEGRDRIFWELFYINIAILIAGTGLSYLLARITLRKIEEAHVAQTRFTADASHELRSPLAAMMSEIEVALRDPKLDKDEAIKILKSNLEEVDRLKNLADGLLELANGKEEFRLKPIRLNDIAKISIENISKKIAAYKAEVKIDITEGLNVLADKDSIMQLLTILLDNALKYSKEKPLIIIEAEKVGRHVELKVIDNGLGISEEDLPHIFDRFYRAEPSRTKNKIEGYGLGLSIAQEIVRKNRGKIEAVSRLGEGTTFKVTLNFASQKDSCVCLLMAI